MGFLSTIADISLRPNCGTGSLSCRMTLNNGNKSLISISFISFVVTLMLFPFSVITGGSYAVETLVSYIVSSFKYYITISVNIFNDKNLISAHSLFILLISTFSKKLRIGSFICSNIFWFDDNPSIIKNNAFKNSSAP